MLAASATAKTAVGARRVKPSDRPRAVAQTASRTPERTRTSQDTVHSRTPSCRCPGTALLVRESDSRTPRQDVTSGPVVLDVVGAVVGHGTPLPPPCGRLQRLVAVTSPLVLLRPRPLALRL